EVGTEERTAEGARYGGKIGNSSYYRIYTKYFDWQPSYDVTGKRANDGWDAVRGGFRMDIQPTGPNSLTLQGDLYQSNYNETLTIPSLNPPYSSTFPNNGDYKIGRASCRERESRSYGDWSSDVCSSDLSPRTM